MQKTNLTPTKILLTGGHAATSALATIEELQTSHPSWELVWVGTRNAFAKEKATTLDFQVFPELGVKCYSIPAGKLQRQFTLRTILVLLNIPLGFAYSLLIFLKERPKVVLSYGGFTALPVVFTACLGRIPVLIHEQTVAIGLANKLSLPFTTEVLLAREEAKPFFKGKKAQVVGLPKHKALKAVRNTSKTFPQNILLIGGSRGSLKLNSALKEVLEKLLEKFSVTHITGSLDFYEFIELKKSLSKRLKSKYEVHEHIDPRDITPIYEQADIVVGRGGAHTVSEVILLEKAAIIVPIPWVQKNEQLLNAKMAQKYINAIVLEEESFDGKMLLKAIRTIEKNWKQYQRSKNNPLKQLDLESAPKIVTTLEKYVK